MKCSRCGKKGAVTADARLGNVLLFSKPYCNSRCMLQDIEVFSSNVKSGVTCFMLDNEAHVLGKCPCGLLG